MREALVVFIVVAAIFVLLLDWFGVFSAWQNVRGDAEDAAEDGSTGDAGTQQRPEPCAQGR